MVNQREPPRGPSPQKTVERSPLQSVGAPEFGKSSPLRNPLKKDSSHIFNIPKRTHARPEHHRSLQPHHPTSHPPLNSTFSTYASLKPSSATAQTSSSPDFVEVERPSYFAPPTVPAAPKPAFSTANAFQPANAFKSSNGSVFVGLTKRNDEDGFDASKIDTSGPFDPTNFMSAANAHENIKALLEGAFDEEDSHPQTRLRKKKQEALNNGVVEGVQNLQVDDRLASPLDDADNSDGEKEDGSVEGMSVKLLPHQIDGLAWMVDKEIGARKKNGVLPKGGILADDMGLGKTIQALALILSNPRPPIDDVKDNAKLKIPDTTSKGTLIVAPLALIKQWESEIKTKVNAFPKPKVLVHHGPSRTKSIEELKRQDIVITTYQTLTSEHEGSSNEADGLKIGCFGVHWYRIILDEAHSIKNRNAKMSKAAYALESVYRWCMTGTPMQNNLDELQSLIRFLRIKPYDDMKAWKEQIGQPMKNGRGGLAMKRIQYFLKAFMKRRTKEILKKDGALNFGGAATIHSARNDQSNGFRIVARNVHTIVAHLDKPEREFYDNLEARTSASLYNIMDEQRQNYIGALVLLLRLRQACNHPQLSRGNLTKEKDSISAAQQHQSSNDAPHPSGAKPPSSNDVDDIASMLGALTVATRLCDACGSKLDASEMESEAVRCRACEEDFKRLWRRSSAKKEEKPKKEEPESFLHPQKHPQRNRIIIDSDDEEDQNGELSVSRGPRNATDPGDASRTNEENIDASDEWFEPDSFETGDEYGTPLETLLSTGPDRPNYQSISCDEESGFATGHMSENETNGDHEDATSSTKIRRLIKILENEVDEHKFIVFSEFTSMLDLVVPFLRQAGFRFARYDGKMKNDDRERSLDRLRNDSRTRILLCSLRCGSLGLNLTAASRVVILEPFWNPFVEEQAIDRVHRLNQTQDVMVYRLVIADSVEQRILDLQEKKRLLANAAVEGSKAIAKLSMKDIMELFKRDAEQGSHHEDALSATLGTGKPAGILQSPVGKAQPIMAHATGPIQRDRQPGLDQDKTKKTPKFHLAESLRPEYEAIYGRRW